MEKKGYIIIQDWMLDLPLSLVETAVYAVIYGFSQDGESTYSGSLPYIARKCKSSKDTARRALRKLVEDGYIEQSEMRLNGVKFNAYRIAAGGSKLQGGVANCNGGVANCNPIIKNNKDINNISIKSKGFLPPTFTEVQTYCTERRNNVNADAFIAYYESNGWMVGKNRMKDWKAAVRTWEHRGGQTPRPQRTTGSQPRMSNRQKIDMMAAQILGGFSDGCEDQ